MDPQKFLIPKQTDENLILALSIIRNELPGLSNLFVRVTPHAGGNYVDIGSDEKGAAIAAPITYVTAEQSQIMPSLCLMHRMENGIRTALAISRRTEQITDEVTIHWNDWAQALPPEMRSKTYVKLTALARKHLRALDVEAGFSGTTDNTWNRYRDSQQAVLNSLQETQRSLLVEFNRRALESERELKVKYEKLEVDLRSEFSATKERLTSEHAGQLKALVERETAVEKREKSFNTKEARYVARQVQQEQIDDIKKWLEGWSLTPATASKWWYVTIGYILALLFTGFLIFWFSSQSFAVIKGNDLTKVMWWQWALLSLKSILPLVAFTTLLVYFIRWASVWSRQHSEEDFRNRARILDIGRSRWLLEAVRDSQDNQKELPSELLRELSKNLFNPTVPDGTDLYPEAITEFLSRGLSSLKVKAPNGIEVEASNTKKQT